MKKNLLITLLLTAICFSVMARTDTIRVADARLLTKALKPCTRQYLVYGQRIGYNTAKKNLALWERAVDIKNDKVFISQKWYMSDTLSRQLYSVFEKQNLRPVYHFAKSHRNGVEAYNFSGNNISGADSVAGNKRTGFQKDWKEPVFNWEIDLETFGLLPYKKDVKFVIPFYHPGSQSGPKYYVYEVVGEEKIAASGNGRSRDCWKLKINYDAKNYAIFWIDKKEKEVLKMEELFNGWYRYKIKLATT